MCALTLIASICLPSAASAEMVKLQFKPATAPPPAQNSLAPIAPFDAAWNAPNFIGNGNVDGNLIPRAGDPGGATTDYVEYARTVAQGLEPKGPIRGDLLVDFDHVDPGLPAIIIAHGGLQANAPCSVYRRITQTRWAQTFTKAGYIVFNADFLQPTNDRIGSFLGKVLAKGAKGDCMADDGWEPGAERAQISLQLAIRSLKKELATFAVDHPGNPASDAFAIASKKVVAFGGSSGGHMASRLALRSEDSSGAPGDGPQFRKERRVAGAVGISSIGECTEHNGVRNQSKLYGMSAFEPKLPTPFASCGPVKPDENDSPIKYFNSSIQYYWFGKWKTMPSPLSGAGGWGSNIGWDGVGDPRWPKRTCEDLNAFKPGMCSLELFPVDSVRAHYVFPLDFSRLGILSKAAPKPKKGEEPPVVDPGPSLWETKIFPQVDAFFRSVRSDDEVA